MGSAVEIHAALAAITSGTQARHLETTTLDFKTVGRSRDDSVRSLAEAAACFANAGGGALVVGVEDRTAGPLAFVGCDLDPVATQRRIFELTDPRLTATVEPLVWSGQSLLVVSVPRSADVHAVSGRCTERIGTSCQPMSTSRIATVVAERRGEDWSLRSSELPHSTADPLALGLARSLLERASDPQRRAYAQQSDADLLRTLGVLGPNSVLTNAGALLFTRGGQAVAALAYAYRRTPAGELVVNEHLSVPLLPALSRVLDLIDARSDRTSVNLPGGQQIQLADLPEAAVREAVVNAVMHRDYGRSGTVQIEHTATRLRVCSPGAFVGGVTVDNVLTTSSRSRNPHLSNVIRALGLAETAGAGVDRMYAEMVRLGHQPPAFTADLDQVQVTLLGGAPNTSLARFVATLPAGEAEDADTMLVLLSLLSRRTVTAERLAPTLQKPAEEAKAVLDRLGSEPVRLVERTRQSAQREWPTYRLREYAVAALGSALAYHRRSPDEYDRKIIGMMQETGEINGRMVKLLLDLDTPTASRVLGDLVERGILRKTSDAQRGPGVRYGTGPSFPKATRKRPGSQDSPDQGRLL